MRRTQRFAVLAKVLGAAHEIPHLFQCAPNSRTELRPGHVEPVDGRCCQRGDNRHHRGIVVEITAFLPPLVVYQNLAKTRKRTSAMLIKCLISITRFLISVCARIVPLTQPAS